MAPYPYQERVDNLLRTGQNVILQAPTGAGKTRAALFPFLDGWRNDAAAFPRQCVYAVPMRVLANQFEDEYKYTVATYAKNFGLRELEKVRIQTGARPEDRKFEADLIFTTIDQVLSSFLTIPYSLSNRQANLNAGAIIDSYLVFDEFHLFPVDEGGNGAMATTLHMLKMLKGIVPFVLMTATFSRTMIEKLCIELDAEPVTLSQDEVDAIPSQQGKQRRYHYCPHTLTPEMMIDDVVQQGRQRTIAICNTVDRAQALTEALRVSPNLADVEIVLLHSRFYASHRSTKEDYIRREFGENRSLWSSKPIILIATQVIEVGLNITCNTLHTEVAPAAAVVQRAGRCARFAKEQGDVFIYDVPADEKTGEPSYAPYFDDGQRAVCERTHEVIRNRLLSEGTPLNYLSELHLVNEAHEPFDAALLEQFQTNRHPLREIIEQVLQQQNRSAARELIRDIDSRTVIIHSDPTSETIPNPYRLEGISMRRKALLAWYGEAQKRAWELGLDWVAKIASMEEQTDAVTGEGAEQKPRLTTTWLPLHPALDKAAIRACTNDLASSGFMVALNPALVQYDDVLGFRAVSGDVPAPSSPPAPPRASERDYGSLKHETYAEHIAGLQRVYVQTLRERTAATQVRLEHHHNLKPGTLDHAIRLMFAVHDLGKLHKQWQAWAHVWQKKVSALRKDPALILPDSYMAAHTDYNSRNEVERQAQSSIFPKRTNHAAESARAGRDLIGAIAGDCAALHNALMSAIICHHSPTLRVDHGQFTPVSKFAQQAFGEAMQVVGLFDDVALRASGKRVAWKGFAAEAGLIEDIIDVRRIDDVVLYLFLVRILRLADQGSQE